VQATIAAGLPLVGVVMAHGCSSRVRRQPVRKCALGRMTQHQRTGDAFAAAGNNRPAETLAGCGLHDAHAGDGSAGVSALVQAVSQDSNVNVRLRRWMRWDGSLAMREFGIHGECADDSDSPMVQVALIVTWWMHATGKQCRRSAVLGRTDLILPSGSVPRPRWDKLKF